MTMDEGDFRDRLLAAVDQAVKKSGRSITQDCHQALREEIDNGLKRSMGEGAMLSDVRLREAEDNIEKLLREMGRAARELGQEHFSESTLGRALSGLCPGLWPFC